VSSCGAPGRLNPLDSGGADAYIPGTFSSSSMT
jgi:hypothetical protein